MAVPKFSIIVPCYNDGAYLPETIASIQNQSFKSYEIIIVDDGSEEALTLSALSAAESGAGVTVIRAPHEGVSHARNIGIEKSAGEYVLTLDADDIIHPTYLAKADEYLKDHSYKTILYTKARFFGMEDGPWNLPEYDKLAFAFSNSIYSAAVFKKSMWSEIGGFNTNMLSGLEDYDFWMRAISKGYVPYRLDDELFFYRIKKHSRTANLVRSGQENEMYKVLVKNNLDFFSQPEILSGIYLRMKENQVELGKIQRTLSWRLFFKYVFRFEWWLRSKKAKLTGRGDSF